MFERVAADVGSAATLHALRHTAAYRMAEDPALPLTDVQAVLGLMAKAQISRSIEYSSGTRSPPGTLALDGCIKYIEGEASPAMDSQPGSLGLSLLAIPEPGVVILESFWVSQRALQASENTDAILRGNVLDEDNCEIRAIEDYMLVYSSVRVP
jgi:hypothetical protein